MLIVTHLVINHAKCFEERRNETKNLDHRNTGGYSANCYPPIITVTSGHITVLFAVVRNYRPNYQQLQKPRCLILGSETIAIKEQEEAFTGSTISPSVHNQ